MPIPEHSAARDPDLTDQTPVLLTVTASGAVFTLIHGLLYEFTGTPVRVTFVAAAAYAALLVHFWLRRRIETTALGTALVTLVGCLSIQYAAGGVLSSGVNCIWAIGAALMTSVIAEVATRVPESSSSSARSRRSCCWSGSFHPRR